MQKKRVLVLLAVGALVIAGGIARAVLIAPPTPEAASPAATDTTAQPSLDLPSSQTGGGQSEGVGVHGDWTIKVMSPDGELVSNTSFENSYIPSTFLADVLARNGSVGFWGIFFGSTDNGPCLVNNNLQLCYIVPPGGNVIGNPPDVFKTLVVSAPDSGADANKLVLSGSATAPEDAVIASVGTRFQECVLNSSCAIQEVQDTGFFTLKNPLNPTIPIVTGQQILITVTISFS